METRIVIEADSSGTSGFLAQKGAEVMLQRAMVTGGAGFIGNHLCRALLARGIRVICVDNFDPYYPRAFKEYNIGDLLQNKDFRLFEGDILDMASMKALMAEESPDTIFHLAALAGVRPSLIKPEQYERVNITGTRQLATLAASEGVEHFVLASSSSVYGINKETPFHEQDPLLKPVSPYAVSKIAAEGMLHSVSHMTGMKATSLRFFTVYGPRQRPEMAIHKFTRLIDSGEKVPFYGDGRSARDYSWIHDIISGVLKTAEAPSGYRVYNLGGNKTVILSELIEIIEGALGKKALLERFPDQQGDVPITFADIEHSGSELDYHPDMDIRSGIDSFVKWYKTDGRRLHDMAALQ